MALPPTTLHHEMSNSALAIERQILCLCSRTRIDDEMTVTKVKDLLPQCNWAVLYQLTHRNGVHLLLGNILQKVCPDRLSPDITQQLKTQARVQAFHNLTLAQGLTQIMDILQAQGIAAIPYKGPIAAVELYGSLGLRAFSDLDIWVTPETYLQASDCLINQGFIRTQEFSWESTFVNASGKISIDLHQAITPPELSVNLDFQAMYARLLTCTLTGQQIAKLAWEDDLLVQSISWCKDCWDWSARLIQLCDVAQLLRTAPTIDWDYLFSQAEKSECDRMVYLTLALAHQWLDAPLPKAIREHVSENRIVVDLVDHVESWFWQQQSRSKSLSTESSSASQERRLYYFRDHHLYLQLSSHWKKQRAYIVNFILSRLIYEARFWLGKLKHVLLKKYHIFL